FASANKHKVAATTEIDVCEHVGDAVIGGSALTAGDIAITESRARRVREDHLRLRCLARKYRVGVEAREFRGRVAKRLHQHSGIRFAQTGGKVSHGGNGARRIAAAST